MSNALVVVCFELWASRRLKWRFGAVPPGVLGRPGELAGVAHLEPEDVRVVAACSEPGRRQGSAAQFAPDHRKEVSDVHAEFRSWGCSRRAMPLAVRRRLTLATAGEEVLRLTVAGAGLQCLLVEPPGAAGSPGGHPRAQSCCPRGRRSGTRQPGVRVKASLALGRAGVVEVGQARRSRPPADAPAGRAADSCRPRRCRTAQPLRPRTPPCARLTASST